MSNVFKYAEQLRRAVQLFVRSLSDEEAMEVATVYPKYEVGKSYKVDDLFTYGENNVGDPQLYRVVQEHISQENWLPNESASLYSPIGLNEKGYPIWSRPTGAHDAYNEGDIVDYNGVLFESLIDGNTYSPEEYPQGWKIVEK